MMKRILLALACLIVFSAPAYAAELNTDTACDSPGTWMADTGWTVASGKCSASGATTMAMLMQTNPAIKNGHKYRMTFTVSNYSAGGVRGFVGWKMGPPVTGSWITEASRTVIDDNFTTANGLTTNAEVYTEEGPGNSAERGGAFRFVCVSAFFGLIDPIQYFGTTNPHLHEFVGNAGVKTDWGYDDFRSKGSSTCGDQRDPKAPINRSGYWFPSMYDGHGHAIRTSQVQIYYKGPSNPALNYAPTFTGSISGTTLTVTSIPAGAISVANPITGSGIAAGTVITAFLTGTGKTGTYSVNNSQTVASETMTVTSGAAESAASIAGFCAALSPTADCQDVPKGIRFITGYDFANGKCGPTDTTVSSDAAYCGGKDGMQFDCWDNAGQQVGSTEYMTLDALLAANICPIGYQVREAITFQHCWDGVHLDSPNHRDHMSHGGSGGVCPASHPVVIPTISLQVFYPVDQAFLDGKWRLTTDEMTGLTPGTTLHGDYIEAWSPDIHDTWFNKCIWAHNTGSGGQLCDGRQIKDGLGVNYDGTGMACNGCAKARPDRYVPLSNFGMSKDITANGTYTIELTAASDSDTWGLMGLDGFTGDIDNISIQEIGSGAHGPVTVNTSG